MRWRQWGPGTLLSIALLASVTTGILYHISKIGITKTFGPLSSGPTIVVYAVLAIVGLVNVLSMPVTLFLGIALLVTSARNSGAALACTILACLVSTANILFWLFYCGGIPGTSQRPFS